MSCEPASPGRCGCAAGRAEREASRRRHGPRRAPRYKSVHVEIRTSWRTFTGTGDLHDTHLSQIVKPNAKHLSRPGEPINSKQGARKLYTIYTRPSKNGYNFAALTARSFLKSASCCRWTSISALHVLYALHITRSSNTRNKRVRDLYHPPVQRAHWGKWAHSAENVTWTTSTEGFETPPSQFLPLPMWRGTNAGQPCCTVKVRSRGTITWVHIAWQYCNPRCLFDWKLYMRAWEMTN